MSPSNNMEHHHHHTDGGDDDDDDDDGSNEITLLERLVWVRYQGHWWPSLLYENYTELQDSLYDQLDMILKAQFAMAILRELNSTKKTKVARLLGRSCLEVVEVDEDSYAEFYRQLPHVLPKACQTARYKGDSKLYLDFHRALDQVQDIIRDVSENNFALLPGNDDEDGDKTWLQRAAEALEDNKPTSAPEPTRKTKVPKTSTKENKDLAQQRQLDDSGPVFGVMDAVMESFSKSFDAIAGGGEDTTNEQMTEERDGAAVAAGTTNAGGIPKDPFVDDVPLVDDDQSSVESGRALSVNRFSRYARNGVVKSQQKSKDPPPATAAAAVTAKPFFDRYQVETRDPSTSFSSKRASGWDHPDLSTEVLPGLDSSDLDAAVPGMGEAVVQAKGMWKNVVGDMNMMQTHKGEKLTQSTARSGTQAKQQKPPRYTGRSSLTQKKKYELTSEDEKSILGLGKSSRTRLQGMDSKANKDPIAPIGPPKGAALPHQLPDDATERALMYQALQEQQEERRRKHQEQREKEKDVIGVSRSSSTTKVPASLSSIGDDATIDSTDRALMYEAFQERESERMQRLQAAALSRPAPKKKTASYYDTDTSDVDSYRALLFEAKQERVRELQQKRQEEEARERAEMERRLAPPSLWEFLTCRPMV